MKITTENGRLKIIPETDFEEKYLTEIGIHIKAMLHLEFDCKNSYLLIEKRKEETV